MARNRKKKTCSPSENIVLKEYWSRGLDFAFLFFGFECFFGAATMTLDHSATANEELMIEGAKRRNAALKKGV